MPPAGTGMMHGWSVAEIDAALRVIRGRQLGWQSRGNLELAGQCQAWIDRLLEARPFHVAEENKRAAG